MSRGTQQRSGSGAQARPGVTAARRLVFLILLAPAAMAATAMIAQACSLFVPFDDYRGTGTGADAADASSLDGSADAEDSSCTGGDKADKATDPSNCGACGRVCVEGAGSCIEGGCPLTALFDEDAGAVQGLAVARRPDDSGADLYITSVAAFVARRSLESGTIEKAPTTGAPARALALSEDGTLGVAAVGMTALESFDPASFAGQQLKTISGGHAGLAPVFLANGHVFWGDSAGAWWSDAAPGAIASGGPDAGSAPPVAFAELSGSVLWVTASGAVFSTSAKNPGAVTLLVAGAGTETFAGIAASRKYLYLTERTALGGGLVIYAVANLATPLKTIAMTDPQTVATDGEYVYVVDFAGKGQGDSRLLRMKADGTQLVTLARGLRSSRGLALEGPWVYFASGSQVLRTSR